VAALGGVALADRAARASEPGIPAARARGRGLPDGDPRIARLVVGQVAVAAIGHAGRPDQRADVTALDGAGAPATIAVVGVGVVADLAGIDDAVAALERTRAGTRRGTGPVGLDVADAVAAVTGQRVAVVALLDAALIVDAVAATGRDGQRTARA